MTKIEIKQFTEQDQAELNELFTHVIYSAEMTKRWKYLQAKKDKYLTLTK